MYILRNFDLLFGVLVGNEYDCMHSKLLLELLQDSIDVLPSLFLGLPNYL